MVKQKKLKTFKKNHSDKTLLKYYRKWARNSVRAGDDEKLQVFITKFSLNCGLTLREAEKERQKYLLKHIATIVTSCIHNTLDKDMPTPNNDAIYMRGIYSLCKSRKDNRLAFLVRPGSLLRFDTLRMANPLNLLGFDEQRVFEEYRFYSELKIILKDEQNSTSKETQEVSATSISA